MSNAKLKMHLQNGKQLCLLVESMQTKNFTQETRYSSVRSSSITPFCKKVMPQEEPMKKVADIFNKFCMKFKAQVGEEKFNEIVSHRIKQ